MGQRSQIYIRYNVSENGKTYKGLIARYFAWNYGERMISRARYTIEEINAYMDYKDFFGIPEKLEKLKRICETNFDMKDILFSSDLTKEAKGAGDMSLIFEQDNNDGQLFIDVTDNDIKYCFMRFYTEGEPMDAEQYIKWQCEDEKVPDWHVPTKHMDKETIAYTESNIKEIGKLAHLMTAEEVKKFVSESPSYV